LHVFQTASALRPVICIGTKDLSSWVTFANAHYLDAAPSHPSGLKL
jgi:hypothetical protein